MLEQLFGSKARVLILRLFLNNPEKFFYVREISRNLNLHLNAVRRELSNLEEIGILASHTKEDLEKEVEKELKDNKKYYKLNSSFVFVDELRSLLIKAQLILEQSLADKVKKLGSVNLFLLSGVFVGRSDAPTDLLLVGTVDRQKLIKLIKGFEKELGRQINYTIMTKQDFIYRRGLTDRFLYDLIEHKNLLLVDDLKA
ncbi:MAG: winged helix-turn-helix domain-containing protein [Patescibacteria group bacterium]